MTVGVDAWLRESADPSVIAEAGLDGNALSLWHRQPAKDLLSAVQALPHAALPDGRVTGTMADFAEWMDAHLMRLSGSQREHLAVIADDMLELADVFAQRLQASTYTFRCHRLNKTMCPRFHTDRGAMRLLCTYRGPGTEWVDEQAVDRIALNTFGTQNDEIVADSRHVHVVAPFTAAVLCGCDEHGSGGVVHRSPAVPEGMSRLTFCMTLA